MMLICYFHGGGRGHLLIKELSGVFLDVSFIQVCGQTHQTDLWEAEVR